MKKISNASIIAILVILLISGGYFFWSRSQMAATPAVPNPEPTVASEHQIRIVAFGDSLTAGYNLSIEEAYPAALERLLLDRGYATRVVNSGVSGETSAGGVRRAEFIRSLEPDIVLFGLGGNDALRLLPPEAMEKNLSEALTILLAGERPPRVLLIGMRAPGNADAEYRRAFDVVYPRLAERYQLPLVPFFLEGVALDPRYTLPDGIHPNVIGYEIIVEKTVGPAVEKLLMDMKASR